MSQVTIQKLLEPISKEVPCGEILEDNPDFFILKDMLDGKEETQWSPYEPPDWKNILRMSKGLLLKGKDLWVVVIFVYASTEIYGLEGLKKGLEFLRDMTTKYWSDIQPELDGENEDDFTLMRLNPLATMASEHEHLCKMLKGMRLIETQRIGKFNYNDIKVLSDETAVRIEALANVEIEHIAADLKQEKYEETVSLLKDCIKIVKEIDDFITEKVGEKNNVSDLSKLISFMNDMMKTFAECSEKEEQMSEIVEQDIDNVELLSKSGKSVKITKSYNEVNIGDGVLKTEQDAITHLKYLKKWYEINYPMSPVATMLENVIKIAGLGFMDMIKAITEGCYPDSSINYMSGITIDGVSFNANKKNVVTTQKKVEATKKTESAQQVSTGTEKLKNETEINFSNK